MDDPDYIDQTLEHLPRLARLLFASIARMADEEGYTLPQMKALHFLYRREPCAVGELAALLGVTPATVSEQIDRLVEARLVERGSNPDDRRQVLITLTPDARDFMRRIEAVRRAQVATAFERLEPSERRAFVAGLAALLEVLETSSKETSPVYCPATAARQ